MGAAWRRAAAHNSLLLLSSPHSAAAPRSTTHPSGNLDGGVGTAAHVRGVLAAAGAATSGDRAVRLSLDEAFYMVHALNILTVHEEAACGGAAVRLDSTVRQGCCRERVLDGLLAAASKC